jgi:hypothetical protein
VQLRSDTQSANHRPRILVVVSIDTEADHCGTGWVKAAPLRFASVVEGIPDRLAPLFGARGARATYLLTTEVMNDPESVDVLRQVKHAELGTHVHGEYVPPDARVPDPSGSQSLDFTCCYPEELERAKLQYITAQFRDRFGKAPVSYRAGRYAASGHTARTLSELGYLAESSVTPGIRWVHEVDASCVLDFVHAPRVPCRPSIDDLARVGDLPIWEIPITILARPQLWNLGVNLYQRLRSLPVQQYTVWLRPSSTSWPWLRWIVHDTLRSTHPPDVAVFNVMFHSMEVIEDASPYSTTRGAARRVLGRLNRLLGLFERLEARFLTLCELTEELERHQNAPGHAA